MTAPIITASLSQNNMDVTIPVNVTNPSITLVDNFNRANSSTTVNPSSDGGTWTSDGSTLKGITNNQAMIVGGSGGITERMRRDLGSSSVDLSIKVQQGTFGGSGPFFIWVSYDPTADSGYVIWYQPYGPIDITRWNSGVYASIGSTTGSVWQNANTLVDLNVIYNAATATVTIKQGGVVLATVTDPGGANGAGTWVGFSENGGYASTLTSWDDFQATTIGATGPFTYTIDYDDGVTDSFTTSSTTHIFTHTYLDTTPKVIKVQAYSGASPSSSVAFDDFNRSNASTVGTTSDGNWLWTTQQFTVGVVSNQWGVISGPGGSNTDYAISTINPGVANCTVQATISAVHIVSPDNYGIVFRFTDANNFWYCKGHGAGSNGNLVKVVGGTGTSLSTSFDVPIGAVMGVRLSDSSITVLADGFAVYSTTDTFNQTATKHGLMAVNTQTHFDDFGVTTLETPATYSNIVLLYPVWVSGSASFGNQRVDFYPRHTAQRA